MKRLIFGIPSTNLVFYKIKKVVNFAKKRFGYVQLIIGQYIPPVHERNGYAQKF